MIKNILIFWIIITSFIPGIAFAYLVPVIGGIWWLIVTAMGFIAVIATFLWLHIIKFKNFLKNRKQNKQNNISKNKSDTKYQDDNNIS